MRSGAAWLEVARGGERGQRVHRHVATGRVQAEADALALDLGGDIAAVGVHREIDQPHIGVRRRAEGHDARVAGGSAQPRQQRRVGGQHRDTARLQRTQDRCLLVGDRLDRAEKADMRLLDRGDHRDMRPRETRERRDLAGMVHADLGDAELASGGIRASVSGRPQWLL